MKIIYLLAVALSITVISPSHAQEFNHEKEENPLKRHKGGLFLGNTMIREVRNTRTGKEQYVLAPTFGLDYEYWISHKWAVGTYNEFAYLNIEVEQENEEFLKRENVMLFS